MLPASEITNESGELAIFYGSFVKKEIFLELSPFPFSIRGRETMTYNLVVICRAGIISCLESRKSNICTVSQSCSISRLMNANSLFCVSLSLAVIPLSGTEHTHLNRFKARRILHFIRLCSS